MIKLITLLNPQLKELLRINDLDTKGAKHDMVARLIEYFKTDEIDPTTLQSLFPQANASLQAELTSMKSIMESLLQTVQQLGEQVKNSNATPSSTVRDNTPTEVGNENLEEGEHAKSDDNGESTDEIEVAEQTECMSVSDYNQNSRYELATHHHRFTVREIAETIPEYDPTKDSALSAEQFVQHIEGARKAYGWNDKCLLLAVYSRLKGVARMWFDSREELFSNWSEFKEEILNEFGTTFDEAEVSFKMSSTRRRPDEKIIDYCFRIHALGRRCKLSESAIIRYAREGMNHRDLQNLTAATKFTSMKKFRDTITEYFNNMTVSARQTEKASTSKPHHFNKQIEKRDPMTTQRKNIQEFHCYNCNEKGHLSRNCTRPQKRERCTFCQRTSHKSQDCPSRQPNVTATKPTINNIADTDDTYTDVVRKIEMNGKPVTAFMDSGSPASLVRKTLAGKCAELLQGCYRKLSGFAGGSYVVTQMMPTSVTIDGSEFEIKLFVVEDEDIPEDVLIGRDLICKRGSRLIIEDGTCRVESNNKVQVITTPKHPQNGELQRILKENRHCIAEDISELGKCSVEEMQIQLTTDVPINMKPYRIAFAKREIVASIISELLNHQIIRLSQSHYASPVVLVEKKNGEHRLCVDYRCLNKITRRTPFPMPNLEKQFAQLSGNSYFTTLDLRMGYHQIVMEETSKQFTAFVTTDGHYEYNRMPFGLVNAPAVFQRVMNSIVSEMKLGEVLVYLDDVIIPSKTVSEGLKRLREFLRILSSRGLTLRLDKCQFLATEIEHLGHIINGNGIRPGKNKINAIKNFRIPGNVTEVRRFMGLTGFFRKFVPDYSLITKPITRLLSKTEAANFHWGEEQQEAFEKIIANLSDAPLLALYDISKQHEVHTDACAIGLAGVLLQSETGKNWQPVMYFSRHCTPAEQVYHSYELEVLAVVESLERFRIYLLGKPFRIVTDCAAITQTKEQRELKPRIARWWLKLQEYDFDIIHRPGNRLAHVDAMSRAPVDAAKQCAPVGHMYNLTDQQSDWVVAMQQRDERARRIIQILHEQGRSPEYEQLKREYELVNGRLYYKSDAGKKFYVPKAVRWSLIKHYHDDMGHFAIEKTLQRLTKCFWFPRMRKLVKEYIKACISCCYNKAQRSRPEGELHFSEPIPIPFKVINIDHLGPFIRSRRGNTHLLVIADAFSKFCILKAVKSTKTAPVISALKEVIGYFGSPGKIISDRGTGFTAKLFAEFCKTNQIRHIQTAVRTPRANGQVERANATILDVLRTSTVDAKRWDEDLEQIQWALNSQPNSTTRFTPNELIFNYDINDAVHNNLVAAISLDTDAQPSLSGLEKRNLAVERITTEREKWKTRFDKRHTKPTEYCEGDLVVIRVEPVATGDSRKLEPKFRGPYIIARALGKDRYVVKDVPGLQLKNRAFNSVYSSDHLKPWCHGYPELVYSEDDDDGDDSDGELGPRPDDQAQQANKQSAETTERQERPTVTALESLQIADTTDIQT